LRRRMRGQRRQRSSAPEADEAARVDLADARRLDDNLVIAGTRVGCAHCGHQLADLSTSSRLELAIFEGPSTTAGPQITSDPATYVDDDVVFRQLCCPSCWTAVHSVVVPRDHADHVSDLSRFALAGRQQ
jgi:N-methylhydantoinase B